MQPPMNTLNSELPLSFKDQGSADEVPVDLKVQHYRPRTIFAVCAATLLIAISVPTVVLTVGSRGQEEQQNQTLVPESDPLGSGGSQSTTAATSPSDLLPRFTDTTSSAGLITDEGKERHKLYGGPSVVDLDRDGYPDMILCYHDNTFARVFFNQKNGTFVRAQWGAYFDNHGTAATPISPSTPDMRFSLSVGGNIGNNPRPPYMYQIDSAARTVLNVSDESGITRFGGRGRTALYADLSMGRHPQYPDVLFLNAPPNDVEATHHFAYESINGTFYEPRAIMGNLSYSINSYGTVTDIENDGVMEIILYPQLSVWKIRDAFSFEEITSNVLPDEVGRIGSLAVAELDFDNDGDLDLYIARSKLPWHRETDFDDYLLENRDGRYVDVSEQAGIPRNTSSRGVTVGDLNNDGWIDILVIQQYEADIMLLNNGDGTFRSVEGLLEKGNGAEGDHAVAVDYDMDGRLDVIYGEGNHINETGRYRLLRNTMSAGEGNNNFVHVRVGNAPDLSCTPLNALIRVHAGSLSMTRRVGSPGNAIAHSYMETQHFGIGRATEADSVTVTYTNGVQLTEPAVPAGTFLQLGRFAT